jgi:hypothetical protein
MTLLRFSRQGRRQAKGLLGIHEVETRRKGLPRGGSKGILACSRESVFSRHCRETILRSCREELPRLHYVFKTGRRDKGERVPRSLGRDLVEKVLQSLFRDPLERFPRDTLKRGPERSPQTL